jgi:hypothetical protein
MCITCLRFVKEVGGEGGGKELNLTLAQVHLSSLLFSFLGFLSRQPLSLQGRGECNYRSCCFFSVAKSDWLNFRLSYLKGV